MVGFQRVGSARERNNAKGKPYKHGISDKVWYLGKHEGHTAINQRYIFLLLTAATHQQEVLHFQNDAYYRHMLDPNWEPPSKADKRKFYAEGDDWGTVEVQRLHQRRQRPRAAVAAPVLCDEDKDEALCEQASDQQMGEDAALYAPSASTSTSCTSLDNDGLDSDPRTANIAGNSSSTNGNASRSSSTADGEQSVGAAPAVEARTEAAALATAPPSLGTPGQPPPVPPAALASTSRAARRRVGNHIPFGVCHLAARYNTVGEVSGYQMTCARPDHNVLTKKSCAKDTSSRVCGGADKARRFLKAWIIFGAAASSQLEHFQTWKTITDMGDDVPEESLLDDNAVESWDLCMEAQPAADVKAAQMPALEPPALGSGLPAGHANEEELDTALLGPACGGVPRDVHRRMIKMAQKGILPITTPEQRARHKPVHGTEYWGPMSLREAVIWCYASPNLPPPKDYLWRCFGRKWILCRKGG